VHSLIHSFFMHCLVSSGRVTGKGTGDTQMKKKGRISGEEGGSPAS
jgi:hypothetical protein